VLYDEGNAIRFIQNRHEQGDAYMALGYAASTGNVGAWTVVPGPGF
jgi:acetolactate synthase I/II/III large subunit